MVSGRWDSGVAANETFRRKLALSSECTRVRAMVNGALEQRVRRATPLMF
jgi:hypothetical protein